MFKHWVIPFLVGYLLVSFFPSIALTNLMGKKG